MSKFLYRSYSPRNFRKLTRLIGSSVITSCFLLAGMSAYGADYTWDGSAWNTEPQNITETSTFTVNSGTATYSNSITGSGVTITKKGNGTLELSGDSSFKNLYLQGGTTVLTEDGNLQLSLRGARVLELTNNAVLTIRGGQNSIGVGNYDISVLAVSAGSTLNIEGGRTMIDRDGGNQPIILRGDLNISGGELILHGRDGHSINSDNATNTLTLSDSGKLSIISGDIANVGTFYFKGGTLAACDQADFPEFTFAYNVSTKSNWTIEDSTAIVLGDGENGGVSTVDVDAGKTITFASTITGTGTLKKTGEGTLVLSGVDSNIKNIEISTYGGEVSFLDGSSATIANSDGTAIRIYKGGTFSIEEGATVTLSGKEWAFDTDGGGNTDDNSIIELNGGSLYIKQGGIWHGGHLKLNGGLLSTVDSADGGTSWLAKNGSKNLGVTVGGDVSVQVHDGLTVTFNGAFHDGENVGSITKIGGGTMILNARSDFTGAMNVNDGTLRLTVGGSTGTLAAGSTVTVTGENSVLELAGNGDVLGYNADAVGTINLENDGTMNVTNAHSTVGAVINMKSGHITGSSSSAKQYIFDNQINVLSGTDNTISAVGIHFRNNTSTPGATSGVIDVAEGSTLTISSNITEATRLYKNGAGKLVFTDNETGDSVKNISGININTGTVEFTGGTLNSTGTINIYRTADGTNYVHSGGTANLYAIDFQNPSGVASPDTATVTLSGGTINLSHYLWGQDANMCIFNWEDGTLGTYTTGGGNNGNWSAESSLKIVLGAKKDGVTQQQTFNIGSGKTVNINCSISDADGVTADTAATLTKTGAGTLVFTTHNTFMGRVTINGGTLKLQGNGGNNNEAALKPGTSITVTGDGSVLELATSDALGYYNADDNYGTITLTDGGTLHVSSTHSTISQKIVMNGGKITGSATNSNVNVGQYFFDSSIDVTGLGNVISADKISFRKDTTGDKKAGTINVAEGGELTISSNIGLKTNGEGSDSYIVKNGAGTLIFSDNSTGNSVKTIKSLTVNEGVVEVSGGTFNSETATISVGGTFRSAGNNTAVSNLTMNGIWEEVIVSTSDFGQISASSVNFNPNTKLELVLDGYTLNSFDSFEILTATNFEMANDTLPTDFDWESILPDSYVWDLNYIANGNGGSLLLSIDGNAIPEPTTWVLLVLGFVGGVITRRIKKA